VLNKVIKNMAGHDIIVIGASARGIETLVQAD
jgi:hypothetical protein